MPKIKRRNKKRIIRKTSKPQEFNEDSAAAIPQFLLDKIPAQASLRPNAQSLRAMMMQRFAQPFIQMPTMTPQQQQAQTLKQNNDVKEQALNQAKQDLIVEQARKQEIQQEEAEHKRRHHRAKAEIEEQKQKLKYQIQDEQEDSKLKFEQLKLTHDLERQNIQSEAMQAKKQVENIKAVIAQEKAKNIKIEAEYDTNLLHQEENHLKQQLDTIQRKNESMLKAIEETKTESFNEHLLQLAVNLQQAQTKNVVLTKLKDLNEKIQTERLEAYATISGEALNTEIEQNKESFAQLQQAMVEQLKVKNEYNDVLNGVNNSRNQITQAKNRLQNAEYENILLKSQINSIDSSKLTDEVNTGIHNSVKKEFENKQMKKEIELKEKHFELEENRARNEATLQYIQSEDYKQNQITNAGIERNLQRTQELMDLQRQFIENTKEYTKASAKKEVLDVINETIRNGEDVDEALNRYRADTPRNDRDQQIQNAAYEISTAMAQTANQETDFVNTKLKYYQNLVSSGGPESEKFRRFLDGININWEEFQQKADMQTWQNLEEHYNRVKDQINIDE